MEYYNCSILFCQTNLLIFIQLNLNNKSQTKKVNKTNIELIVIMFVYLY